MTFSKMFRIYNKIVYTFKKNSDVFWKILYLSHEKCMCTSRNDIKTNIKL